MDNYSSGEVELLRKFYKECDSKTWPYFPIVMPSADGRGPAKDAECDKIKWEVWDQFANTHGSFEYLTDAIKLAMEMNKKVMEKEYG